MNYSTHNITISRLTLQRLWNVANNPPSFKIFTRHVKFHKDGTCLVPIGRDLDRLIKNKRGDMSAEMYLLKLINSDEAEMAADE